MYKSFQDRYLNKLEIGFRLPPEMPLAEAWETIQSERRSLGEALPLCDERGINFWFVNTKPLQAKLHQIDSRGKDSLYRLIRKEIEQELVLDSIIEEAWASNIIEGAYTTHKRAVELVRKNLMPKDKNELMMKNNYLGMAHLLDHRDKDLTIDFILEIHAIITKDTMDDPQYSGRFRDDDVFIWDKNGTLIFKPMPSKYIEGSLTSLINWSNSHTETDFIHPIIKASIIHFYIVFVHPFFDGNGRTARALFYYFLLKHSYDFFKYFSISNLIAKQREKYYKAIKDVEDFDFDITYFLLYSADIVLKSIGDILDRILKKYQIKTLSETLETHGVYLNKRQYRLLRILIEKDIQTTTTSGYQKIFKVSYATAWNDLNQLVTEGIFHKRKLGRGFVFDSRLKAFLTSDN